MSELEQEPTELTEAPVVDEDEAPDDPAWPETDTREPVARMLKREGLTEPNV
jgi:hypothetical protein